MMRSGDAFVLGALSGAVVLWLWGKKIEDSISEKAREVRTKAADRVQAVEDAIRPVQ